MPAAFLSPLIIRALSHEELTAARSSAQLYQLVDDFIFDSEIVGRVTVPAGFVTDFASVPTASKWFVDDDSPQILFASVIHDHLYSPHASVDCTRSQADAVLAEGMALCGASYFQRKVILLAVRTAGGSHWKK
jgi:hypothetical protein